MRPALVGGPIFSKISALLKGRKMKTNKFFFVASLAIGIAACGKVDDPAAKNASSKQQPVATVSTAGDGKLTATPGYASVTNPMQKDARQYLCQSGAGSCKASGPLVANTEAEAQWLLVNGYPSEAELARLERMSLEQLKAEAQSGNKAAVVIYGKKTAIDGGRFQEGLGILRSAASSGSLYAYYGISEVYASDIKEKNLIDSAAYLRLAYLLGDGKASADIALRGLSGVEGVAADERAASLYRTFAKYRRPSPRPIE